MVSINNLTQADCVRILTEPDNAIIKQVKAQLAPVELQITEEALQRIAQLAIERGTGARGLNSAMHNILREAKYEIPGSDITAGTNFKLKIYNTPLTAFHFSGMLTSGRFGTDSRRTRYQKQFFLNAIKEVQDPNLAEVWCQLELPVNR